MNKIVLPMALIALILSVFTLLKYHTGSEVAYVDINKLMEGYQRTQTERESFNKKVSLLKANVDSLMVEWQNELASYEKERLSMGKKELVLKQELLKGKQKKLNDYQQIIQNQIQEENQKITQTIINDINDYVAQFGERNNCRIILGAQGSGNIMYANEATDLTETVLAGLNQQYGK